MHGVRAVSGRQGRGERSMSPEPPSPRRALTPQLLHSRHRCSPERPDAACSLRSHAQVRGWRVGSRLASLAYESVGSGCFPCLGVAGLVPLVPRRLVGITQVRCSKEPNCPLDSTRPRFDPVLVRVAIEKLDVHVGKADTKLHTSMLPLCYPGGPELACD